MLFRSWLGILLVVLLAFGAATPAFAAPEPGTMVWGLHVTLVSRWLDPGETEALSRRSWCCMRCEVPGAGLIQGYPYAAPVRT